MARAGQWVKVATAGESYTAFIPNPLPPANIDYAALFGPLDRANQALGRLHGLIRLVPSTNTFLYSYVRKEAVLSSQIEGTQSSLSDLLLFEEDAAPNVPIDDVHEVSSYVAAMNHGLARLRDGFPLSLRLLREVHGELLQHGRGAEKSPGEFRRSQNWIGGTRPGNAIFVPPPVDQLDDVLGRFEKFLHDDTVQLPLLVRAGLAHAQFETIHPFLDGNGRVGRLLITLMLCAYGVLSEPLLYLSLYFKHHRTRYYDLLQAVRVDGAWEPWLAFFLEGVAETATQAADTADKILDLFQKDRAIIQQKTGRLAGSALRVHEFLQRRPVASPKLVAREIGLSQPTTNAAIDALNQLGMLREMTGRQRDRLFAYLAYFNLLSDEA
jgi:Fic family protein